MEDAVVFIKKSTPLSPKEIPVKNLFLWKYGTFPQTIRLLPASKEKGLQVVFHVKSVLDWLHGKYGYSNEFPIIRQYFHPCSKKYYIIQQYLSLPNVHGIQIHLKECYWVINYTNHSQKSIQPDYLPKHHFLVVDEIKLFYLSEHETFVQQLAHDLIYDETLCLAEPKTVSLRLIAKYKDRCTGPGSFYLTGNTFIKKPHISDLAVSYGGESFLPIHNKILTWLNKKDASGLVLLHGAPGSGKTHYIRYLMNSITHTSERQLIYVPGDLIHDLSNPNLIPLLLKYQNSLLILEDAEASLSRSRTSSQSVANLLNLSDGLLSDGVQVQILATFNCPLESLDAALLRPGRLIVQHHFPATLSLENTQHLAKLLGIEKFDEINESLSLANIYAMKDDKLDDEDEAVSSSCRKCLYCKYYDNDEE